MCLYFHYMNIYLFRYICIYVLLLVRKVVILHIKTIFYVLSVCKYMLLFMLFEYAIQYFFEQA